ncbi:hypothetical protein [Marinobacter arenosus]|uniref:hypothetical protein n=1 Tax=Marinobacter arenosus TaxID=2856822 RepID=UPI001E39D1D9|nr:hypothetical protein [Marinobacter arenosus]
MIELVKSWIDEVNEAHKPYRQSCTVLQHQFDGFYSPELLRSSYFVIVKALPMPKMPELREAGLGDFIDIQDQLGGITYKDTYYLVPDAARDVGIHFHELVYVIQSMANARRAKLYSALYGRNTKVWLRRPGTA